MFGCRECDHVLFLVLCLLRVCLDDEKMKEFFFFFYLTKGECFGFKKGILFI